MDVRVLQRLRRTVGPILLNINRRQTRGQLDLMTKDSLYYVTVGLY